MNTLFRTELKKAHNPFYSISLTHHDFPVPLLLVRVGKSLLTFALLSLLLITRYSFAASGLNTQQLYDLVQAGNEQPALQLVMAEAETRGGWGAAPGNTVVYDPTLAPTVRGAVEVRDTLPAECTMLKPTMIPPDECHWDLESRQDLVRFGASLFSDPQPGSASTPRTTPDDVLSTYIEEVGHSWQEYFYETEGRGEGARTHLTTWEEGSSYAHGWEYQIKTYILSLDGSMLELSSTEHARLMSDICDEQGMFSGYANPVGHDVLPYGPPPGWPNPGGWPTTVPTAEDMVAFCGSR